MIELLGIGVPGADGGWLLHRVCARLGGAGLVLVISRHPEERHALLDAVAGHRVPVEGRIWMDGVPVMKGTRARIRELAADVPLAPVLVHHRSLLWNVLAETWPGLPALGVLRFPRSARREAAVRALAQVGFEGRAQEAASGLGLEGAARLSVARALARGARYLLIREPERALGMADAEAFLALLSALARVERLTLLASVGWVGLAARAGRVLVLADGVLVFDGAPGDLARAATGPRLRRQEVRCPRRPPGDQSCKFRDQAKV